ncbi:MAG: hypothetical protein AB3N13_16175 [Arenibacterium sp.]
MDDSASDAWPLCVAHVVLFTDALTSMRYCHSNINGAILAL